VLQALITGARKVFQGLLWRRVSMWRTSACGCRLPADLPIRWRA